jgi:putative Holliday junction resolvase
MRVLALDYGRQRCGCAVSDPSGLVATPLDPVPQPASRRGRARLRDLIRELGVERVVVGLPVSLSGRESAQTAEARGFAQQLEAQLPVPVELYDERYTTRLAQRTGGVASEDSRAAAHLLESWLAAREANRAGSSGAAEAADG